MRRTILKMLLVAAAIPLLSASISCQQMGFLLYLFAPPDKAKNVEAEYKLSGRVALVFYTDDKVRYEYPFARAELSYAVAEELRKNVKDMQLVDVRKVMALQDQRPTWDTLSKSELGRLLEADYVLQVTLVEFTTADEGSINIYRGKISAEAAVYKVADPNFRDQRVWRCESIGCVYPEKTASGVPADSDRQIRAETIKKFAQRVAWKFYKHEEPGSL